MVFCGIWYSCHIGANVFLLDVFLAMNAMNLVLVSFGCRLMAIEMSCYSHTLSLSVIVVCCPCFCGGITLLAEQDCSEV